jgi:hypothetical protein
MIRKRLQLRRRRRQRLFIEASKSMALPAVLAQLF